MIVGGGCLAGWYRIVVPYMALGFLIVISLIDLFLDRFSLACPSVGVDIITLNPLNSVVSIIIPSVKTSVVGIWVVSEFFHISACFGISACGWCLWTLRAAVWRYLTVGCFTSVLVVFISACLRFSAGSVSLRSCRLLGRGFEFVPPGFVLQWSLITMPVLELLLVGIRI